MTEKDFASEIEWEGGIVEALDYGLKSEDCEPGELQDAWKKLEAKWVQMQKELGIVESILNEIDGEDFEGE